MHKLVEYICDELDELERKADKDGKLSMAEVQYIDTLAHAKKNLLKSDEMMDYSTARDPYTRSMARRRGRYSRRGMSYDGGLVDSIYEMMDDLPEDTRREAQKFVKKLEEM